MLRAIASLALPLLAGCNSGLFEPETNPCELYEYEIDECAEDALYYLQDDDDVVSYFVELDCPDEASMTEAEFRYYSCLDETWAAADCTTTAGLLDLALAVSDCSLSLDTGL